MEVEAKFCIPNEQVFERLLEAPALASYSLGSAVSSGLHDTYLDTPTRAILAGGYACRLRRDGDHLLLTLKGLGGATAGIHRRLEYEIELPGPLPIADWPGGAARDLAIRLAGSQPLVPLFALDHIRHDRPVMAGEVEVAQLSLDRVRVYYHELPEPADTYLEVEAELLPGGREEDLAALAAALGREWELPAENRSKFERALALLDDREAFAPPEPDDEPSSQRLEPDERAIIERLAAGREVLARRARLLLALDDGLSRREALERSGLSPRRARHWLLTFRQQRLGVFPRRVLAAATEDSPGGPAAPGVDALPDAAAVELPAAQLEPSSLQAAEVPRIELLRFPGLAADDPMSEAGRKTFRFHFSRMLYNEPGTRLGQDPEALHDMRVATRRMRAAFRIFGPYYDPEVAVPIERGLRQTGRMLGAVRDLDVFRDKVQTYLDSLSEPQRGGLAPLLEVLETRRSAARDEMCTYLDGKKYARLRDRLAEFVETEGLAALPPAWDGPEPLPYRVRHVAPVAIYERLAAVRAFDEWVTIPSPPVGRLHALRIAAKRLRYAMEFFREVLAPSAKGAIADVVALQDHLGDLQDAVVASAILRDFLMWGTWGHDPAHSSLPDPEAPVIAPGVAAYLAVKQSELQQLLDTFPALWERFRGTDFGCRIAAAVSDL